MRIGFDFDKVFINYPPFIPYFLIDFLYKGRSVFKKRITKEQASLHYRFPGIYEQRIRELSHYPAFRTLIKENIKALKIITKSKKNKTYLISSRFSFLKKRTDLLLKKHSLNDYFDGVFFNYKDEQPHVFKEETIRKLKIDAYIDDDLQLALYLSKKLPDLKIFWVKDGRSTEIGLPKNITAIKNLMELKQYFSIDE